MENITSTTNHVFFAFNESTFYPGKKIDGVIVFVIQKQITQLKVGILWKGQEFVSWYQGVRQQVGCSSQNEIFNDELTVSDEIKVLEPGTYTYKFSWDLPPDIPANYEEATVTGALINIPVVFGTNMMPRTFGEVPSYIRYSATAYIKFTSENEETEENEMRRVCGFKVVEAFDKEILVQPALIKEASTSYFLGGKPLKSKLTVFNGGVLFSGQNLYVNLVVENNSKRYVDLISFTLVEYVTFTSTDDEGQTQKFERKRDILHANVKNSHIPVHGSFKQDLMFNVPKTTPPTIAKGKHISRIFELECKLTVPFGSNQLIKAPVTILEWSPLLKDELPTKVPVSAKITDERSDRVSTTSEEGHLTNSEDGFATASEDAFASNSAASDLEEYGNY